MSGKTWEGRDDRLQCQAELTAARQRLLAMAMDNFAHDPAVRGVFLSGSLASGIADAWSDIDLRVVVRPERHAEFVERRLEIPKRWDGFLFNEWLDGASHCVSHFRPFNKIDIFYLNQAASRPSPWLAQPTMILHDPEMVVADRLARSTGLRFIHAHDEVGRTISKGLAAAHEAYRRTRRGELVHAHSLLDELRQYMTVLDDALHSRPPQSVVLSRWEARAGNALRDAVMGSYPGLDAVGLGHALRYLASEYRRQIIAVHGAFALDRPLTQDLEAVDLVLDALR